MGASAYTCRGSWYGWWWNRLTYMKLLYLILKDWIRSKHIPRSQNFKLFDNSWRKHYTLFFVLDFIYHFTCGESTYPKILFIIYMRDYKLSTGKQFDVTKLLKYFQFFASEYFCDFNDRLDWRRLTHVNCLKETWNVNSKTQSRWNIKHSSMSRGRQNTIYLRRYTQIEHADNWSN